MTRRGLDQDAEVALDWVLEGNAGSYLRWTLTMFHGRVFVSGPGSGAVVAAALARGIPAIGQAVGDQLKMPYYDRMSRSWWGCGRGLEHHRGAGDVVTGEADGPGWDQYRSSGAHWGYGHDQGSSWSQLLRTGLGGGSRDGYGSGEIRGSTISAYGGGDADGAGEDDGEVAGCGWFVGAGDDSGCWG